MKEIRLTQDQVTLVDDEDYEWLSKHKWYAQWGRYTYRAYRMKENRAVSMSVVIMQPPQGMEVDHVNGVTLDNRRINLRIATSSQNKMNRGGNHKSTSRFKGVSYYTDRDSWVAQIKPPGAKCKYLGAFSNEEEAARAYDTVARELYGKYAFLNFPQEK